MFKMYLYNILFFKFYLNFSIALLNYIGLQRDYIVVGHPNREMYE